MFESIQHPESTVDVVAKAVKRAIFRGELRAGERLPAERKLAETFGVNRVTIRSALDRLTTAGLVSRRQGSGYRVLDYRRTGGPALLGSVASLASEEGGLLEVVVDLMRMRRSLARALFEALSERLDDVGRQGITAAVEAFAVVAANSNATQEALIEADLGVLMALLDASQSKVLALCFNPILRVLNELPVLVEVMYAEPQTNLTAYRLLLSLLNDPPADLSDRVLDLLAARDRYVLQRLERVLDAA